MKTKTNFKKIIGIDISKKELDVCLTNDNQPIFQGKFANTDQGLKILQKKMQSLKIELSQVLFCCENTGIYTSPLLIFAQKNSLNLWVETPLAIKKSLGLTRGKSDKADAHRIAQYGYRYQDQYKPWTPPKKSLQRLKSLWKCRKNILKHQTQIKQNLTEIKSMQGQAAYKEIQRSYQNILKGAEKDLKQVDQDLKDTLASDEEIQQLHDTISSVDGVGATTAIYLIVLTEGFKKLNDPRKLACHAGVTPFEHTSGTSIKGKSRVSFFANKELKCLLHLCALSLLKMKNTFSDFIERQKKKGKHIMSILNALRNKILHTICACVRKGEKYDKNYTNSLA